MKSDALQNSEVDLGGFSESWTTGYLVQTLRGALLLSGSE